MPLDIFFREDVTRILSAAMEGRRRVAQSIRALDPDDSTAYERGFTDAINIVAVAFGLLPMSPPTTTRPIKSIERKGKNDWT